MRSSVFVLLGLFFSCTSESEKANQSGSVEFLSYYLVSSNPGVGYCSNIYQSSNLFYKNKDTLTLIEKVSTCILVYEPLSIGIVGDSVVLENGPIKPLHLRYGKCADTLSTDTYYMEFKFKVKNEGIIKIHSEIANPNAPSIDTTINTNRINSIFTCQ